MAAAAASNVFPLKNLYCFAHTCGFMAGLMCWSRQNAESLQSRNRKVTGMDWWLIRIAFCHILKHRLSWGNQNQVHNNQTFIMPLSVLGGFFFPRVLLGHKLKDKYQQKSMRFTWWCDTQSSTLSCTGIIKNKIDQSSSLWFHWILLCVTATSRKKKLLSCIQCVVQFKALHFIQLSWVL